MRGAHAVTDDEPALTHAVGLPLQHASASSSSASSSPARRQPPSLPSFHVVCSVPVPPSGRFLPSPLPVPVPVPVPP